MTQLTIRGFDEKLANRLREVAKREGLSLNKAAVRLMSRGAGLEPRPVAPESIGDALDGFMGSWSAADEKELLEATRLFA